MPKVIRTTVDLAQYPDLVVIYLGMRANSLRGMRTLVGFGPKIRAAVAQAPHGLLRHENIMYGLVPPHLGMRQYWRDFDSLERWVRTLPHLGWWQSFVKDSGGTIFWREAYLMRGGMEAVYLDSTSPLGFSGFAPVVEAQGSMFSARGRVSRAGH